MKITKLIPLALAMMLMTPAFAAATNNATSTMTLTLDKFINIKTTTPTLESLTTYTDAYDQVTMSTPMTVAFNVTTNDEAQVVNLKGSAAGFPIALYKAPDDSYGLIFANTRAGQVPTEDNIKNISDGQSPAIKDNPNCFAFKVTPTVTPSATLGGAVTPTNNQNNITYALKNGAYDCSYAITAASTAGTFSPHDTYGTYVATLTMTAGNP